MTHALIVEDNARNVAVLARLLAEQNITSTQVTNPKHLDGLFAEMPPVNVVFVDLEMPGLSGYDVLAKIKARPEFAGVPVVAYTVHVSEMTAAQQRGFDGFIGKPLDPDRFPAQLSRILSGEAVWETP